MSTGYRPPSTEPRGRWARHIHAFRREHGWSQTRGFEAVREGLGLSDKSRSAYIAIDIGKRPPTPAEELALAAVYGYPPEAVPEPLEATETPDPLVQALMAQTAAITALVEELREQRLWSEDQEAQRRAAAVERALREPRGGGGLLERSAPPERVG